MVNLICEECKEPFTLPLSFVGERRSRQGRFCSTGCASVGRGRMKRGPNHYAWKGGTATRPSQVRQFTKKIVRVRGICEKCGATQALQGHHIVPYAKNKELALEPTNIRVLCVTCHVGEHPGSGALIRGGHNKRVRQRAQHLG